MAMRLLILGTEARHYHIRSEIPNDPHDVSENFVVIPDVHCFVSRLRKPEIDRSRKKLLCVIDAWRIEPFLCSNSAEPHAKFLADQILPAIPPRNRKITTVVNPTVRPQRHELCGFFCAIRRDVTNPATH